jgi:plexin A
MFVRYRDVVHSSSCQVLSNQRMECRSPSVPVLGQQISPEEPMSLDYGFLMDDVPSVRNLSHSPNYPKFLLYPDPVYEKFDEEVKYYKSDYLTINGINLDRACQVRKRPKKCNIFFFFLE